jgi:hypothetical protein
MKFHGDINLQDNEMQQMVVEMENNFPAIPIPGRVVFKDKRLYICVEVTNGLPFWIPLTNEISSYTHAQGTASDTWTVVHNMETTSPLIQVYDENSRQIIPDEIEAVDQNTTTIKLGAAGTGRAVVMYGNIVGGDKPQIAFEQNFTSSSTTWVVTHNLGYEPIIRAFVGTREVQPQSIVHDTVNQTTITFSTPQVGFVRCI